MLLCCCNYFPSICLIFRCQLELCVCVCVVVAAKSPKDNINKPEEERAEAIKVPLLLPPLFVQLPRKVLMICPKGGIDFYCLQYLATVH